MLPRYLPSTFNTLQQALHQARMLWGLNWQFDISRECGCQSTTKIYINNSRLKLYFILFYVFQQFSFSQSIILKVRKAVKFKCMFHIKLIIIPYCIIAKFLVVSY